MQNTSQANSTQGPIGFQGMSTQAISSSNPKCFAKCASSSAIIQPWIYSPQDTTSNASNIGGWIHKAKATPSKSIGTSKLNPPWDLIPNALAKLKEDKATVLACLPVWPAKHWWRQVLHMQVGPSIQIRHQPIFRNQSGRDLYPPRWATLFTLLKGRA